MMFIGQHVIYATVGFNVRNRPVSRSRFVNITLCSNSVNIKPHNLCFNQHSIVAVSYIQSKLNLKSSSWASYHCEDWFVWSDPRANDHMKVKPLSNAIHDCYQILAYRAVWKYAALTMGKMQNMSIRIEHSMGKSFRYVYRVRVCLWRKKKHQRQQVKKAFWI